MGNQVKALLQKINFIEADMELHRQILVSIPSDRGEEIQQTMVAIAAMKGQIHDLRQEIKARDEIEYNRMIAIEKAARKFQALARDKTFVRVHTLNETGECFVTLNDGTRMDCLVAAREENGNWTLLTLEGETKEFPAGLIK